MAETPISVRDVISDDARSVAALLSELGYAVDERDVPARVSALRGEGGSALLATDETGMALGLICLVSHSSLHAAGRVAYITALVTASSARRRGAGRVLVEHAKEWARSRGCVRLTVTSAEHRADAHAFYPACGLPYTGRRFAVPITPA